jgi:hypothetical protein
MGVAPTTYRGVDLVFLPSWSEDAVSLPNGLSLSTSNSRTEDRAGSGYVVGEFVGSGRANRRARRDDRDESARDPEADSYALKPWLYGSAYPVHEPWYDSHVEAVVPDEADVRARDADTSGADPHGPGESYGLLKYGFCLSSIFTQADAPEESPRQASPGDADYSYYYAYDADKSDCCWTCDREGCSEAPSLPEPPLADVVDVGETDDSSPLADLCRNDISRFGYRYHYGKAYMHQESSIENESDIPAGLADWPAADEDFPYYRHHISYLGDQRADYEYPEARANRPNATTIDAGDSGYMAAYAACDPYLTSGLVGILTTQAADGERERNISTDETVSRFHSTAAESAVLALMISWTAESLEELGDTCHRLSRQISGLNERLSAARRHQPRSADRVESGRERL